ncbi:MAG: hypothetical protein P8Y99_00635 [Calditrichaceae bacterium]
MKRSKLSINLIAVILFAAFSIALAQDDYQEWLKKEKAGYQNFLDKEDKAFADFLKKEWKAFQSFQGIKFDEKPKPVTIPTAKPEDKPAPPPDKVIPAPEIKIPEQPPKPKPKPKPVVNKTTNLMTVDFYGAPVSVNYKKDFEFSLATPVNNEVISKAWETMAASKYKVLLEQIEENKKQLEINDWGYLTLVDLFAKKLFPNSKNEQNLFSWFIVSKSGYDTKVAYMDNTIYFLVPSENIIFANRYVTLDNKKYYFISMDNPVELNGQIYTYTGQYKGADRIISMRLTKIPILKNKINTKNLSFNYNGKKYTIPVQYDHDIIDYLKNYPQTELPVYFDAAVSEYAIQSLIRAIEPKLQGMSELEAVNFLLRFVQTAFDYKTDDQQFGKEKYLMMEETLHYPSSDCEDRSILFSYLVKKLLNLHVVGLDYPGHIATAVKFKSDLSGDRVNYDGQTYIICDPTYINANAGMAMPQFKEVDPKVIQF